MTAEQIDLISKIRTLRIIRKVMSINMEPELFMAMKQNDFSSNYV